MSSFTKHRLSVASGALACLASVLGKVAFDADTSLHALARRSCNEHLGGATWCNVVGLAVQAVSLAGMVCVNAVMLSTYLRALHTSGSTVATVINCATSFVLSGLSGRVLFGEHLPAMWFGGAACIVLGVAQLVCSSSTGVKKRDEKKRA